MVFLPHTNTVIFTGTVLWYYDRACVTCGYTATPQISKIKMPDMSISLTLKTELVFVLFLDYHFQCICGGLIVDF